MGTRISIGAIRVAEARLKKTHRKKPCALAPLRAPGARPIQLRLAQLVVGRAPEEALFSVGDPPKLPARQLINVTTSRVCKAAGVPVICPHSLRGLWATLSVEAGAAESAVATALGHGSFEMTAKHYAQPEALTGAKSARTRSMGRHSP